MVTHINTANREKYQVLFDKAEKVLLEASEAGTLPAGIDINQLEIATLNQYFAYLKDIIDVSSSEDIKRYFTRLPLDEDFLEINANTRAIKIPTAFARNGVGVQGDEMAEVVYFTIDRYFDAIDLANEDIKIIIQWEARDRNKQPIVGISPNYGKDIETIPGKIIFGWPIYSELTQTAGNIKFAVRFFSFGEAAEDGLNTLTYSLATLPAELSIGSTINYDLLDSSIREIDRGSVITGRIKNTGIYDPSIPIPTTPIISTPLYVIGEDSTVRIIDLATGNDPARQLAISATPADIGAIIYDWKQWPYDSTTGEYSNNPVSLISNIDNGTYVEMTENLGNDTYYRITSSEGSTPVVYAPISVDDFLASTEYDPFVQGFNAADGSVVKLYKKLSVATVTQVGIYTVNAGARYGTNVIENVMNKTDGVKIPGPLKPTITDPETSENISVTADHVTHVITNDGTAVLKVNAVAGETGKAATEVGESPLVTLSYKWKKYDTDGIATDIVAPEISIHVSVLPASSLPTDEQWQENAAENGELGAKGIFNQEHASIVQNGDIITIYSSEVLKEFESTDISQGTHKWLALDIDTGLSTIEGVRWNDSYTFTTADENELGVADGHILFWLKADETPTTRSIDDTTLTFRVINGVPATEQYNFNNDQSEITIYGLPENNLDNTYYAEVTATRNGVKTTEKSGNYRLTNSPTKPVLKYLVLSNGRVQQVEKDYMSSDNVVRIHKTSRGTYNTISFSVEPPTLSDNLSYVWMRANIQPVSEVPSDWEGAAGQEIEKLQIDLDDMLPDLFADVAGDPDIPVNEIFGLTTITNLGQVVEDATNGPSLALTADMPTGYYYCIVINELNNSRVANVSPFFQVTE